MSSRDEIPGRTLETDFALFEEDRALADFCGNIQALLDHDQGDAGGMDAPHHLDQLAHHNRCQAEGHLIDTEHLRIEQKRLCDGDLLLLAARESARLLPRRAASDGKVS